MNLTPVTKAEMKVDRLELGKNATVKFVSHNGTAYVTELTLTQKNHWSITSVANLYINVDFFRLLVWDAPGYEDIFKRSEYAYYEGVLYKFERQHRPNGLNRVWDFKLEPLADYPNDVTIS